MWLPNWFLQFLNVHSTSSFFHNLFSIQGLDGRDGYGPAGPKGVKVHLAILLLTSSPGIDLAVV